MLKIYVILAGEMYRLPNKEAEIKYPRIFTIKKGIEHIFKEVIQAFPEEHIHATWDEDKTRLSYTSDTVSKSKIHQILFAKHGEAVS